MQPVGGVPAVGEPRRQRGDQRLSRGVHSIGVDHGEPLANKRLGRHEYCLGGEGGVVGHARERLLDGRHDGVRIAGSSIDRGQRDFEHQLLQRLITGEGISFVRGEEGEVGGATGRVDEDGRGEAAVYRQHGGGVDVLEDELM